MKNGLIAMSMAFGVMMGGTAAFAQDDRPFDVQLQDACTTDAAACTALVRQIPRGPARSGLAQLAVRSALVNSSFTDAQKQEFLQDAAESGNVSQQDVYTDSEINAATGSFSGEVASAWANFQGPFAIDDTVAPPEPQPQGGEPPVNDSVGGSPT